MSKHADRHTPMAAAPMRYSSDGSVDWGSMWDTFCELAQAGGPAHRATTLEPQLDSSAGSPAYQAVVVEIVRGVGMVSGLTAGPGPTGWIAIHCDEPGMAAWLAEAIVAENVCARSEGSTLYVPAGQSYTLKGEIKNVITAVAKTTHYWGEHAPAEVRAAMALQESYQRWKQKLRKLFRI